MPRKLRVECPGAICHVITRGDRREDIFQDELDRQESLAEMAAGIGPEHYREEPCEGEVERIGGEESRPRRQRGLLRIADNRAPATPVSCSRTFSFRSPEARRCQTMRARGPGRISMKAKIIITPKQAVVDPQGKTVQSALEHMGYRDVRAVHVGKYIEIELNGTDREAARQSLEAACQKFLSNPVIEDYHLDLE